MGDHGATVAEWLSVVRRAELPRNVKTAAYYLAGRANNDGTHIFPGVWRSAVECKLSPAEVRRALKLLRDAGLVEVVKRGNRRRHKSDEYRLILGADVMEHVKVPSPDEHDAAINAQREREHEQQRARRQRMDARRRGEPVDNPASTGGSLTLTQESVNGAINAQDGSAINAHPDERAPRIGTSPVEATLIPDDRDLRTDLKVGGAAEPVDNPGSLLGVVGSALPASLASGSDDTDVCPACGVLLDPGSVCGNRRCTDYGRTPQ
jgi:DNA-binding transcriptional ArsR family regulator